MRTVLRQLGRALPVGSAMLILAACGSTPAPTVATTATAISQPSSSVLVHGSVMDSSNRPLAGVNVECMGNVQCTGLGDVSAQDGPDQGVKTSANGSYELIMAAGSGGAAGGFLVNANARGYQIAWREVKFPSPACTSNQASCAITLNFALTPQAE